MFKRLSVALVALAVVGAACSSNGGAPTQGVAGATSPASAAAGGGSGGGATVLASPASGKTVLVAGSNGMTLYTFTKDVADSGKSNCNGGCLSVWPALVAQSGATPTEGPNCHGKLGTITRSDGTSQVTYNGLPLYFYAKDTKPGDTNGSYPNWNLVTP